MIAQEHCVGPVGVCADDLAAVLRGSRPASLASESAGVFDGVLAQSPTVFMLTAWIHPYASPSQYLWGNGTSGNVPGAGAASVNANGWSDIFIGTFSYQLTVRAHQHHVVSGRGAAAVGARRPSGRPGNATVGTGRPDGGTATLP